MVGNQQNHSGQVISEYARPIYLSWDKMGIRCPHAKTWEEYIGVLENQAKKDLENVKDNQTADYDKETLGSV